ncbi:unnamed protein product [Rhizoctonia solani]|uniref:Uncharacterized protein n=1 Tax=Rhizoctonia solani TaxID=456999 RepID=A0A8H3CJ19_9AGAM|nr:unnamed protein product [Rhizoctonia solani]
MPVGSKCLMNLCIFDAIISHVDGKTILHLAVTCRWVWDVLKRSQVSWRRALSSHEDFAPFPGAYCRTAHTLVVLHFSSECVMCGRQTNNPILSNHAVRLCNDCSARHLVAMGTHTIWQNGAFRCILFASYPRALTQGPVVITGPHLAMEPVFLPDVDKILPTPNVAQVYPAQVPQILPANFDSYLTPGQEPAERIVARPEATASLTGFYTDSYLNRVYSSPADIDVDCGFPTDLEDEVFEGFTGTPALSNDPTNHHGPCMFSWQ